MHERFETHSEEETRTAGRRLAAALPPSALVAFSGDLGSGKTAFIRGMCEFFGCAAQVSSPTFALINEYEGAHRVSHCDLYRLTLAHELREAGLEALFAAVGSARSATVLVEWAERAAAVLPLPRYEVAARHGETAAHRRFEVRLVEDDDDSILFSPEELSVRIS